MDIKRNDKESTSYGEQELSSAINYLTIGHITLIAIIVASVTQLLDKAYLIKHEQAYEMGMIAIRSLWCLLFVLAQVALLPFLVLYRKNSTTYNQIYDFMTAYRILLALIIAGGLFWNVGEGVRLMNDVWVAATATAEKPVSEQGPGGSQSSGAMPTVGTATRCRSPC